MHGAKIGDILSNSFTPQQKLIIPVPGSASFCKFLPLFSICSNIPSKGKPVYARAAGTYAQLFKKR